MASNFVKKGDTMTIVAAGAVLVDSVQQVGAFVGVAITAAAGSGDEYELGLTGVYGAIPRTNVALAQGAAVYWNGTAVTATDTDKFMGHAAKTYAIGTTAIEVRLAQDGAQA